MRHYDELLDEQRGPFQIIVDKTWEDIDPRGQFEEDDVEEIIRKINDYTYDWFMLRVRVLFDGRELAYNYLGGCLYEDAREVLTDGTAEDVIYSTLIEAKDSLRDLKAKLAQVDESDIDKLLV